MTAAESEEQVELKDIEKVEGSNFIKQFIRFFQYFRLLFYSFLLLLK